MKEKPDIVVTIGRRIELRLRGRDYFGICPFHAEQTPSFAVSQSKQVYFCHSCHESGDVIDFIRKIDGASFRDACRILGMDTPEARKTITVTPERRRAGELAAGWALEQRAKLNVLIGEALEDRDLADELNDSELAERFERQFYFLTEFFKTLEYPRGVAELLAMREGIESITEGTEVSL